MKKISLLCKLSILFAQFLGLLFDANIIQRRNILYILWKKIASYKDWSSTRKSEPDSKFAKTWLHLIWGLAVDSRICSPICIYKMIKQRVYKRLSVRVHSWLSISLPFRGHACQLFLADYTVVSIGIQDFTNTHISYFKYLFYILIPNIMVWNWVIVWFQTMFEI